MRLAFVMLSVALVAASCGGTSSAASSTPSSSVFGTATLFDDHCDFGMPDKLPIDAVKIAVVNKSQHLGRFLIAELHGGHTVQDVIDYTGQDRPDWADDLMVVDVPASLSSQLSVVIPESGIYAMHCGYADPAGHVIAFWHQLTA